MLISRSLKPQTPHMFESVFCTMLIKKLSFGSISELLSLIQYTVGICFSKPHILILMMVCLIPQWENWSNLAKGFNPLTPNDPYNGRTAPLTSKRCILYIYSTNTGTEYFKQGIYSPFFLFKMQFVS